MTDKWRSQPTAPHRRRESTRGLLEAEFEAALRQVSETLGGLDIVCNNAGITQATPLGDYTPEDFDNVISINIKSVLNGCQAAARLFEAAGTKGASSTRAPWLAPLARRPAWATRHPSSP